MDIIAIVEKLGFPIGMSLIMIYLFKSVLERWFDDISASNKRHIEEISQLREVIKDNTIVIQKILEVVELNARD